MRFSRRPRRPRCGCWPVQAIWARALQGRHRRPARRPSFRPSRRCARSSPPPSSVRISTFLFPSLPSTQGRHAQGRKGKTKGTPHRHAPVSSLFVTRPKWARTSCAACTRFFPCMYVSLYFYPCISTLVFLLLYSHSCTLFFLLQSCVEKALSVCHQIPFFFLRPPFFFFPRHCRAKNRCAFAETAVLKESKKEKTLPALAHFLYSSCNIGRSLFLATAVNEMFDSQTMRKKHFFLTRTVGPSQEVWFCKRCCERENAKNKKKRVGPEQAISRASSRRSRSPCAT